MRRRLRSRARRGEGAVARTTAPLMDPSDPPPLTSLRTSGTAYGLSQVAAKVFGFGFLLLAANVTSRRQLGTFVAGVLFAGLLALLLEFGRASHTVRQLTDAPSAGGEATAELHGRLLTLWIPPILFVIAGVSLRSSVPSWILFAAALACLLAGNSIAESGLLALRKGGVAGAANLAFNFLAASLVAVLSLTGISFTGSVLLGAQITGAACASLICGATLRLRPFQRRRVRRSNPFGSFPSHSRAGFAHLLLFLSSRSDQLCLAVLGTPSRLGVYGLASRVTDVGTSLPNILATAAQPSFVVALRRRDAPTSLARYLAGFIALTTTLAIGLSLVARFALPHAIPAQYAEAATLVSILSVGLVGYGCQMFGVLMTRCADDAVLATKTTTQVFAVQAVVSGTASAIGLATFGVAGLAFGRSAADILCYSWMGKRLLREGGFAVPLWLSPVVVTALAALGLSVLRGTWGLAALPPLSAVALFTASVFRRRASGAELQTS